MSRRRFMISSRNIRDGYASFNGDLFNHMVRVLRLGTGDGVTLVDEAGNEHQGVIDQVSKEWVAVRVEAPCRPAAVAAGDRGVEITICQALPKGEKIDLILQKGTELGVHDFHLFGGLRSVARVRPEQRDAKLERWQRITAEAARQCNRRSIPAVSWSPSAAEAAGATPRELRLLLWEGEQKQGLKSALADRACPASVVVAVGPEGGFDPLEVQQFLRQGYLPVSLGTRILRTETAAIAITAILQYIWDAM
ncbi:16S rRNA (uracil(1498)-N(3))-methyltransferase [Geobacter sp. AOG2]|uniref:16S rRNA (uracil(1498)-N(3))-methyltransferase n=1 Tax=Geobacter sp. AOG2 TaxID=1566347 RepID=UPI001CC52842|nr:16S rRNA (uracil(1498)-N(3))-methyltransferase [Geobacter sp. AOG2]GFE62445.1 ribosomal RNA small subunit methyltransferase E [Geobacter sp. AOG2]